MSQFSVKPSTDTTCVKARSKYCRFRRNVQFLFVTKQIMVSLPLGVNCSRLLFCSFVFGSN